MRHATDGQLVEYLDGELRWIAHWRVRRHLRTCWQCRTHADEMRALVGDFVRYRTRILIPSRPAPPRPWADLPFDRVRPPALSATPFSSSSTAARLAWRPAALAIVLALAMAAAGYLAVTVAQQQQRQAISKPPQPRPPAVGLPQPAVASPAPRAPAANARTELTEIQILAALHRIGADLGEAIELRREAGAWTVAAIALGPGRESEVRAALPPAVRFVIEQPRPSPEAALGRPATGAVAALAPPNALTSRLGGPAAFERTANRILEESDALLGRAYALRNLERRFPSEAALDSASRELLGQMRRDHRSAFTAHAGQLEELTRPVRDALNAPPVRRGAGPPHDRVEAGQRLDQVLNALLAGAPTAKSEDELAAELSEALGRLGGGGR